MSEHAAPETSTPSSSPENTVPAANSPPPAGFHLPTWLWAPYALYAISAACILVGISQIIGPIYEKPDNPPMMELLSALGALNLYEVVVLGLALALVLWFKVVDDVIALTLIIGIFLIASTVALDQVASYFPAEAVIFGIGGLVLAAGKLLAVHRWVTGRFEKLLLLGLLGLLAWNTLMPGILGRLLAGDRNHIALIEPWRIGLAFTIGSGLLVLIAAMRLHEGSATTTDTASPFLRRPTMRWVLVAIVLVGTITHQFAITWAFNIPVSWRELIPMSGLLALLLMELRRAYGRRHRAIDSIIALAPLVLTMSAALFLVPGIREANTVNTLSDPSLFLVVIAMLLVIHGWRRGMDIMFLHAGLYGMAATLLIGIDPALPFAQKWLALNWNASAFALSGTLAVLAAFHRSPALAVDSAIALSLSLITSDAGHAFIEANSLNPVAVMLVLLGSLTQIAYCIFRRTFSTKIAFLGVVALAVGVIHCFYPSLMPQVRGLRVTTLDYPLAAGLVTLAYVALVSGWTHNYRLLVPGSIPLAVAMISQRHHGWVWVAMSFIVLALGAVASVRKSLAKRTDGEQLKIGGEPAR